MEWEADNVDGGAMAAILLRPESCRSAIGVTAADSKSVRIGSKLSEIVVSTTVSTIRNFSTRLAGGKLKQYLNPFSGSRPVTPEVAGSSPVSRATLS